MKKSRLISLALCICMVMSLFTGFTASASADDVITHTVANGDYLFKVCKSYGLDYYQCKQAIMALNGFTSEQQLNRISVGQRIKLPASNAVAATVKATTTTTTTVTTATTVSGVTTTTSSTSTVSGAAATVGYPVEFYLVPHKVVSGETLDRICTDLGTSYYQYSDIINAANGITNVNSIKAGTTVYIPTNVAPASGSFYGVVAHKVTSGQTVTSICGNYGTNYESNKKLVNGLNSSVNLNKIYANQKLLIPVLGTYSSSSTAAPVTPTGTPAPTAEMFQLSFNNPANGDPSATVGNNTNATRAAAGQKVTINANADAGYAIASVKATRTDSGANLKITDNTFVMPKSDVAISVSYAKGLTIKKTKSPSGTFDTLVGGTPGTSAFYGDMITLVLNPSNNYVLDKSIPPTYQKADGSLAAVDITDDDNDGFYTFRMPNYNIKVTVTYKLAEYYKLVADKVGQGSVAFYVKDKAVTKALEEDIVTVKLTPANGYVADADAILADNSALKNLKKISANEYSFEMETADVTFIATFKNATQYKLTAKEVTGGSVRFNVQDAATLKWTYGAKTAKENDIVQVVVTAKSKYIFDDTTGIAVTYTDTSSKVCSNLTSDPYLFIMPGANVTAKPAFVEDTTAVKYKVSKSCGEHGKFIVLDGSGLETSTIASGETVTLEIYPNANYSLKSVKIKDGNGKDITAAVSYDDTAYTFTMPEKAVTVAVTFKSDIQYVEFAVNYDVTQAAVRQMVNGKEIYNPGNASIGSFVYLDIQPKDGYEIDKVEFDGKEISKNSDGKYGHKVTEDDYNSGHEYDSGNPLEFTVTMKAKAVPVYTVLYSSPDTTRGDYTINGISENYLAEEDETVTIVATVDSSAGYKLGKIIVDGLEVSSGDIVHVSGSDEYEYSFIMPARDVITKVTFVEAD